MMSEGLSPVGYTLEFADGHAMWQVYRLRVSEAIDRPYDATLDAMTEAQEVDTEALLGTDATLTIGRRGGQLQYLYGVVVRIDYLGFADHHLCVRFHLAPAFQLLVQRIDSRIWQKANVADIVSKVLGPLADYGRSFDPGSISRGAAVRDYCVQYRESDHDYVTRLLEEEGISYLFVHEAGAGSEMLTLRDDNEQYPAIEGAADLPIILENVEEAGVESIQRFEWSRTLTSTASLRRDFDWKQPAELLTTPADGKDERGRVRRRYAHGDRRYIRDDQTQQSADGRKSAALSGAVAHGLSNATVLRPGLRFKIAEHERDDLIDREFIVTEVVHTGSCPDVTNLAGDDLPRYANEFICIPADVEIRPVCRTPKPRVHGPQTAIVTGDGEIHTDADGRIQVQFHWEEKPSYAADSSCWIRCAQTWAGLGWGAQFIPRVGMEVVVEFLEGNPDRPLVIGCVYNGANPPPFALPDTKTQSGWRTNSSPGGEGFNELRFEDLAGSEQIFIHAQKDFNEVVLNHHNTTVGSNQTNNVDVDQIQTVHGNQSETVDGNQEMTVSGSRTVHVVGAFGETIDATETRTVAGDVTETFAANETRTIAGNQDETISGSVTRTTLGSVTDTTLGSVTNMIFGSKTEMVTGGITTTTPGNLNVTATGGINMTTSGAMLVNAVGGFTSLAPGGNKTVDVDLWSFGGTRGTAFEATIASCAARADFTGLSISVTGVSLGATGISNNQSFVTVENRGSTVESTGAAIRKAALHLAINALCIIS